ncbi:toll/interleukin-1 receptor domain-containing protein [Streptomyces sp. NPDC059452]|uniref:toll/interleukin-1 receptor domain-containing protein n=1 Tax=Streptomyces sp. NPDC059452 TaxID=3346835 RepID=UPI00369D641C
MMAGIFINYRTGDGDEAAVAIDGELLKVFGKSRVFRDRRNMGAGTDFPPELRAQLEKSTVLLVLIGSKWLRLKEKGTGKRRIDLAHDFVREEIRTSLEQRKLVIPVLLDLDSDLPGADELPEDIARLSQRQAARVRVPYTHIDVKPLVKELRRHVPAKKDQKSGKKRESGGGTYIRKAERSAIAQGDATYYENAPAEPAKSPKPAKSSEFAKATKSPKATKRKGAS